MLIKKIVLKIKIEIGYIQKRFDKQILKDEKINKMYIKKYLSDNPVIIDAGANNGSDSIEMTRLYSSKAKIYAFEPLPEVFKQLKRNIRRYKNIKAFSLALSNENGEQELHVSSGASIGSSSLLKPKTHLQDHPDVLFVEKIKVKTVTLDEWAKQNDINYVDFLWLDLQGFELEVLKESTLIFPTVKVVHMEVSTKNTYEGVTLYPETKLWMEKNGFYVDKEAIPKGWDMGNVLFIRKN
jgi:FkbM family methyltransferase